MGPNNQLPATFRAGAVTEVVEAG
ncbi:MAG: hypothetical protein RL442_1088, partial [Pseudomonadota bacterium]